MTAFPSRLTAITLGVRDRDRMRDFYCTLGFPIGNDIPGDIASFLIGGVVLCLFPIELLTAEAAPGLAVANEWRGVTLACNVDTRDDVDRAFRAAIDAGATPVADPVDREWGGRSAYFADPEGNRWEVAWAPGLEMDARGVVTKFGD